MGPLSPWSRERRRVGRAIHGSTISRRCFVRAHAPPAGFPLVWRKRLYENGRSDIYVLNMMKHMYKLEVQTARCALEFIPSGERLLHWSMDQFAVRFHLFCMGFHLFVLRSNSTTRGGRLLYDGMECVIISNYCHILLVDENSPWNECPLWSLS